MTVTPNPFLSERLPQIYEKGKSEFNMTCERASTAGSVSQRACTFCGSRVVLYPIADALHIVHGPIGCAAYTWDIRGALSSGPQLHRNSFCTDLHENEVIFGGEKKLKNALIELIDIHKPKAAFIYSTCIAGIIGDDVDGVCKSVASIKGIPVIPVHSEGFKGTKKDGYRTACEALFKLVGMVDVPKVLLSVNILGDFNIAGELWIIKEYFRKMGVTIVATITGDGRVDDIKRAHTASLNIVQCSGSMQYLAKLMKEKYDTPFINVSFFGIEDTAKVLYDTADFFDDETIKNNTIQLVKEEITAIQKPLEEYRKQCLDKKAALYVGGAFKAISLVKALRLLGMQTVLAGTQTGNKEDYDDLRTISDEGTVIVDDSNPIELSHFLMKKGVDLLIGGVKERPLAYKLGIGFCDHNHERKIALAGFEGMVNFAKEVAGSVSSPVWKFAPFRQNRNTSTTISLPKVDLAGR